MKEIFNNKAIRFLITVVVGIYLILIGILFAGEDPPPIQFIVSMVLVMLGASFLLFAIIKSSYDDDEEKVYKSKDYSKDFEQLVLKYEVIQPPIRNNEQSEILTAQKH